MGKRGRDRRSQSQSEGSHPWTRRDGAGDEKTWDHPQSGSSPNFSLPKALLDQILPLLVTIRVMLSGLWNKMTKGKPSSVNSSTFSKRKEDKTMIKLRKVWICVGGWWQDKFRCHLKDQIRPCKDWRWTRLMIIFTCRRYFALVNLSCHPYAQHHSYFRVFPGAHLSGT